ncbi:MAG: hypothetical protein KatS3mg012_0986 [Gaiellaceae bacterium]|jgi:hypothetical protein|nr:MAG: hypothetical protein KatS3mg012_0986 [Gaiellaceae bacterium]
MAHEPLSPELALVDPELAARARAALPEHPYERSTRRHVPVAAPIGRSSERRHGYPFWARVTGALWLFVIGVLVGGAAIPHAQDRPRVVEPSEEAPAVICEVPAQPPGHAQPSVLPTSPRDPREAR